MLFCLKTIRLLNIYYHLSQVWFYFSIHFLNIFENIVLHMHECQNIIIIIDTDAISVISIWYSNFRQICWLPLMLFFSLHFFFRFFFFKIYKDDLFSECIQICAFNIIVEICLWFVCKKMNARYFPGFVIFVWLKAVCWSQGKCMLRLLFFSFSFSCRNTVACLLRTIRNYFKIIMYVS